MDSQLRQSKTKSWSLVLLYTFLWSDFSSLFLDFFRLLSLPFVFFRGHQFLLRQKISWDPQL